MTIVTQRSFNMRRFSVVVTAILLCMLATPVLADQSAPQDSATSFPLDGQRVVVVGGGNNYKPFHFIAGGAPTGFDVDLVRCIGRVMGLNLEIRLAYWQDIRDGLVDGTVHAHIGMTHSPERAASYDFTSPYLTQHYKIFVTDDARGISGEDDLHGKQIIVQQSGVMADYLRSRGMGDNLVPARTAAEALRMLELGDGDCCVMTEFRGITVAQDLGLDNIRRVGKPIYYTRYGFAVAQGNEDLVLAMNQGLALLKRSGEYDRIYEKWFGVLADQGPTTGDYLRFASWIISPLLVAFLLSALWSWSLRRQVIRQTTELRQARDQAETASKAKSRFLTAVSHEIRTPLNGVLGMAQLVYSSELDTHQREQVSTIRRSATKLQDIINDILEFSRIDAGTRELDQLEFSLPELIKDVVEGVSPDAWSKGLVLEQNIGDNLPDKVAGDPSAVRQVLLSLLSNAVKFTASGAVSLQLNGHRREDGIWWIEGRVDDTGQGVAEDERPRLFDAFTQADSSSTRRYGGTGLGLAICKHLTELMGGWVRYESRAGSGSRFCFAMALESVASTESTTKPQPSMDDAALPSDPILVVEDNVTNQRVVCLLLKKWGYGCEVAENGREAVEAFSQQRFAAVIMDCQMPVMDGLEATRVIRAQEAEGERVPIIALTAGADLSSRKNCLTAGMDDYLTKPLNARALQDTLKCHLAASRETIPVA